MERAPKPHFTMYSMILHSCQFNKITEYQRYIGYFEADVHSHICPENNGFSYLSSNELLRSIGELFMWLHTRISNYFLHMTETLT